MNIYPADCIQNRKGDLLLVKYPPSKKNDPAYSKFRSVVFDQDSLVSVSPSKSISYEVFKQKYSLPECRVEEFVEGTMINAWYRNDKWNISTRTILDATCYFESTKSFADMFHECMNNNPIELNSEYCYSLVMQHPDNVIITPVTEMKLIVVGRYKIVDGVAVEYPVTPTIQVQTYEEAEALAQTVAGKGLMLKCNGERAKIKRTAYYELEQLKGNSPFHHKYLFIRNTPEAILFLNTFPWYSSQAVTIENQIHQLSNMLYDSYVLYYIRKQTMPAGFQYKKMLYDIHSEYKTTRVRMTQKKVNSMVNQLHPYQLTTLLRLWKTAPITPSPPGMIL
jgi:hypothetical protein